MPSFDLYVPTDLRDALSYLGEYGESTPIIARGTDLLPRLRRRQMSPTVLLDISGLEKDLRYVRRADGTFHIGALTTVTDLLESAEFGRDLELIREAARKFGAPQIRNTATIGGNVCSASSSEDFIPVLLALDARVKLLSLKGERSLPIGDLLLGKRTLFKKSGELLSEIEIRPPPPLSASAFDKLGRRSILIIALVNMAVMLTMETDRETIREARVALNRVSGRIPQRAAETEKFLAGKKLTLDATTQAQAVLSSELILRTDFRASGEYRAEIAKAFLKRLLEVCVLRARGG